MKKLLMVSNGEHLAARIVKATLVLLITLALGTMFWVASTPISKAQNMSPERMIESQLPQGKTVQTAGKAEFLAAVCAAVKKFRSAAPAIVRSAVDSHPEWKKDILRTAFRCIGSGDCRLLNRVLHAAITGHENDARELTELAIELAPDCASAFGGAGGGSDDEGNFGNPPGNLNPPPGSIGGGGGQGNVIAVCFNGVTQFFSPEGAQDFINTHPGATLGACQVTQSQNN
jgi:hypothetical protein